MWKILRYSCEIAQCANERRSSRMHACARMQNRVFYSERASAREREQAYGTVGYWTKVKFILHYFSVRKWADVLQKYAWACVFTASDFCLHFNCDDVSLFGCTREIFLVRAEQQLACFFFFFFFFAISKFGIFNPHNFAHTTQKRMKSNVCTCTCVRYTSVIEW